MTDPTQNKIKNKIQLQQDPQSGLVRLIIIGIASSGFSAGEIDFSIPYGISEMKTYLGNSRCEELSKLLVILSEDFKP